MILVYALSMFTNTGNIFRNYFTSIVENKYIVKSEISRTVIGAVVKVILLWLKAPVEYFIFAQLFDTILVTGGYYYSYRSFVGSVRRWNFNKDIVPFLLKES